MPECPTCDDVGEVPDGPVLPRVGGFPHPDQGFSACPTCADAAALRAGIGPESRGLMGEDVPDRSEVDEC